MLKPLVILVSILFLFATYHAEAQDSTNCDPLNISVYLTLGVAQAQRSMYEGDDLGTVLDQLIAVVEALRAPCAPNSVSADATAESSISVFSELSFSGDKDTVIGPEEIEAGTYRAIVTTDSYVSVEITAVSGECGEGSGSYLSELLFSLIEGDAVNGAQAVLTSRGCSALFAVSNVRAPWTLVLEKVG